MYAEKGAQLAAQFSLKPLKLRNNHWCAAMTDTDGNLFEDLFSEYIHSSGTFGLYKTKKAASQHEMTAAEKQSFFRACISVFEEMHYKEICEA